MGRSKKYISKNSDIETTKFSLSKDNKRHVVKSVPSSLLAIAFGHWLLIKYDPRLVTSISRSPDVKIPKHQDCKPLGFYITINWIKSGKTYGSYRYELLSVKVWGYAQERIELGRKIILKAFRNYTFEKDKARMHVNDETKMLCVEYQIKISSASFFSPSR